MDREYYERLTIERDGDLFWVVDWDGDRVAGPFVTALQASADIEAAKQGAFDDQLRPNYGGADDYQH